MCDSICSLNNQKVMNIYLILKYQNFNTFLQLKIELEKKADLKHYNLDQNFYIKA